MTMGAIVLAVIPKTNRAAVPEDKPEKRNITKFLKTNECCETEISSFLVESLITITQFMKMKLMLNS
ncbi:MAG: hypothetical protein Fur006_43470 [Coleofasciculaceae cyanobacterium]